MIVIDNLGTGGHIRLHFGQRQLEHLPAFVPIGRSFPLLIGNGFYRIDNLGHRLIGITLACFS